MRISIKQLLQMNERRLIQLVLGGIILSSVASLLLNSMTTAHLGRSVLDWLSRWMLDMSTDLISGGVVMTFIHFALKNDTAPPVIEGVVAPQETTYFIEAKQVMPVHSQPEPIITPPVESPPTEDRFHQTLTDLQTASTPNIREALFTKLREDGYNFEGITLVDMDLQGIDLRGVNLQKANLTKTKLRSARLNGANLRDTQLYMAQLIEADLQGADLSGANLDRTYLSGANFQAAKLVRARIHTSLWRVNLQQANLEGADLSGAELFRTNLKGANLIGVQLNNTKINTDTILPDGTLWTPSDDITRFTDPNHAHFWRAAL